MTHWLPYHRDQYFLSLQKVLAGAYVPQFVDAPAEPPKDPETVKAAANRGLDAFSNRADAAIRKYQKRRAMRGN